VEGSVYDVAVETPGRYVLAEEASNLAVARVKLGTVVVVSVHGVPLGWVLHSTNSQLRMWLRAQDCHAHQNFRSMPVNAHLRDIRPTFATMPRNIYPVQSCHMSLIRIGDEWSLVR
jgi:hypothetical protein